MSVRSSLAAARRAVLEFAVPLLVVVVFIGAGQFRDTASAAPAPGSDGSVVIDSDTNDSSSPFTLTASPVPANCPGDSASDGFTVSAFIAPAGTAVSSITFGGLGPQAPAIPLLTTTGSPHVNIATAPNTGQIINQPPYTWAFYPEGTLPDGDYVIGYACHKDQVAESWFTETVTITNTGGGALSFVVAETTLNVPEAPAIDSVTPGNGVLVVEFTPAASGDAAEGFEVRATGDGNTVTATGTESPVTVTGLTNGTTYDVVVVGANAAGEGAASDPVSGTPTEPAAEAPGAPTISSVTPGDASLTVAFTAGGGGAATSFTVTASDGVDTFSERGAASPLTVDGLDNGTEYEVTVVATNDVGSSDPSAAELATPVASTSGLAPSEPTIDSVDVGDGQVTVNFTPGTGAAATEYTVTATDAAATGNSLAETKTATGTSSPITVTGLDNGVAYVITLTATNGTGSVTVEASTQVTPTATGGSTTGGTATGGTTGGTTTSSSTTGGSTASSTSGGQTIPATGSSSTMMIVFWGLIVLMLGRIVILLTKTPGVVTSDR